MPICDPYWLVRSRAYILNLSLFGKKSTLQQSIELLLFNNKGNEIELTSYEDSKQKIQVDLFEKIYGSGNQKLEPKHKSKNSLVYENSLIGKHKHIPNH